MTQTSKETLQQELARLDAAHVLHPHAVVGHPEPPVVWVRGRGALLWDAEGREYVDGTCGLWQCAVGHGRAELARVAAARANSSRPWPTAHCQSPQVPSTYSRPSASQSSAPLPRTQTTGGWGWPTTACGWMTCAASSRASSCWSVSRDVCVTPRS